ncbi:MAG: xanthine dehydrogenase family protein molybdopterin-binding subunit [Deltaproteobacteria bacterium]|nr:xanthine dehydrogenase family protein molybdopterin-binding subunit [Deltaproteobacteria bacterium]
MSDSGREAGGHGATRSSGRQVGLALPRKEDIDLLTGRGTYVGDLQLPGMLWAAIYRSPMPHARLRRVDLEKAAGLPGVVLVLSGRELPDYVVPLSPFPFQSRDPFRAGNPTIKFPDHFCLARDKVRFVGEPVAAVVATDKYIAEDAVELVEADFDPLPPVVDPEEALKPGAPLLYNDWGDNLFLRFRVGADGEEAFRQADLVIRERIRSSRFTGTPIEPRGILARYEPTDRLLTIWSSTQIPHILSTLLEDTLRIPGLKVRVIAPRIGGGFGQKWGYYPEESLIPLLAILSGRPVKWIETRSEHMMATIHARDQIHDLEAAVTKDGRILGLRDRIIADAGVAYPVGGLASIVTTSMFVPGAYKIRHYQAEVRAVTTNKAPYGAHRGFGKADACFAIERLVQRVADRLGLDPAEVRFRNFIQPEDFPYISATGSRYDSGNYPAALTKALELAEYEKWRQEQARLREQGRYLGIGIGLMVEPSSSTRMGSYNSGYYSVTLRIDPMGRVFVLTGGNDEGQGHATTISQLVADELGVPFDDILVIEGDTLECPYGSGSYASRFSVVGASAVILAARQMREKVLKIAAVLLGEPEATLTMETSRIFVKDRPEKAVTLVDVAKTAYYAIFRLPEGVEPELLLTYHYRDPNVGFQPDEHGRVPMFSTFPYDANVAVVEVIPDTGQVKILKYVSVHDCGNMINPAIVQGQHVGALVHGLGGAMYEEIIYDETGQLLTGSFKDYFVPTAMEVPNFILDHLVTPNPFTPGGFKGAGETGTVGPPPVLCNAVEDALKPLGIKVQKLPLSPSSIRDAIREALPRAG